MNHPPPHWADKVPEDFIMGGPVEPWHELHWVRRGAFVVACLFGLAAALTMSAFNSWHAHRRTELAAQRGSLRAFFASAEFAELTRKADRQLAATINFVAARPQWAARAFPAVAAAESERRERSWTLDVPPLPAGSEINPKKLIMALRQVNGLLARRGFQLDERGRAIGRGVFLRAAAPYASAFVHRAAGNGFPALPVDRSMQDAALAAYAASHDIPVSIAETERLFAFYAMVGPIMAREIAAEREAPNRLRFGLRAPLRDFTN
jgi:hypothetical protein